ncbi:sigma-70 family RNA polymerase sigma factor [Candidatus Poribacteria bacterium]|nr:sigma-70 family RNA polymerase sigma factor [Candidatus Poribacteria bacterium]MYK94117.1 sigma-70 family RNA polymerase sigma factor [Candidatus Poribacteria bacterium]
MKNDDAALIRRVLAGDEAAFAELVNKYQKPVHTLAWRKIGDFHIAEDITQDAFLKVYQRLHTLKDPNQFSGWLYVITANLCATWLRKKRIQTQPLEDTETTMIHGDAYSQHVTEERSKTAAESQREVVKKLLAKLKESERTVMTLHYLGEMTVEEISRFLGVSVSTIKTRLRRARRRLQKEETMIREALEHFQITPNLTDNIMREVARLKPAAPSGGKPLVPWAVAAATVAVVVLMLGIGNQHLSRFQKPYSFDATSEMTVEIIEAPIVLNLEAKPDVRTQLGGAAVSDENDVSEKQPNDAPVFQNSQTWSLPENAIARFGKGVMGGSDRAVAFSPDGQRFAVATGAGIWIYDAQTYREMALLTGHTEVVRAVAFSPDGKILASGAQDATVKLWNVENGENIATFVRNAIGVESVAFSPNGKILAAGTDSTVELWNIENGQNLATFEGHAFRVFSVAFSSDGRTVASGAEDNTIKLWNVETKQNIATLIGHKRLFSQ